MLNHIVVETLDNEYNFFNVKEFHFDKDVNSYVILSQNDDLHCFARENVKRIIL
jgi:hypothetical protein